MGTDENKSEMTGNEEIRTQRVCIVGAGAGGLCALRHLAARPDRFELTCYEQTSMIGGTWNYTDMVGKDQYGQPIHSSMYKNLRTNLPMEIMEFPDFQSHCDKSYVHHTEVLKYLSDYARHFGLYQYINFHHRLVQITREGSRWLVVVENVLTNEELKQYFDVMLLCTGRYSVPYWPPFKTLSRFGGHVIHSHDYRQPEPYAGQRVAVIGGGLSGIDICVELSPIASEVILINRSSYQFQNLPANIKQLKVEVKDFTEKTMTVHDAASGVSTEYELDAVIVATGYHYNMRFVDGTCGLRMNKDGTIDGLYRQMINIEQPSMALLAVSQKVLPFPLYHQQILYYMKILLGDLKLPSAAEMTEDTERDIEERLALGHRPKDRHMMEVDMMVVYMDKLIAEAKIEPIRPVVLKLYRDLYPIRKVNITGYKRHNYKIVSDKEYVEV